MLPAAEELAPGLHRWVAYHEEWKKEVASVALDAGERLVLIDPLAPAGLRDARAFWKALDTAARAHAGVDVIVTLHYHRRSAGSVVERYRKRPGAALWTPQGSAGRLHAEVDHAFAGGDPLPGGIEARPSGLDYEARPLAGEAAGARLRRRPARRSPQALPRVPAELAAEGCASSRRRLGTGAVARPSRFPARSDPRAAGDRTGRRGARGGAHGSHGVRPAARAAYGTVRVRASWRAVGGRRPRRRAACALRVRSPSASTVSRPTSAQ